MVDNSSTIYTHTYEVNIQNSDHKRQLKFEGYHLKGRADLTDINKATGEAMWPCCALLADYLNSPTDFNLETDKEDSESPERLQVLELGCGLGLAGAVASVRLGSSGSVLMTDGDAGVVERAKQMSKLNYVEGEDAEVTHSILWWGDQKEMQKVKEATDSGEGFDLIVASDIIYDSNAEITAKNFAETTNFLLKSKDNADKPATSVTSKCLVAFQQRSIDVEVLNEAFDKVGFDVHVPPGEYYEDIFMERHDERTCFTDKLLLCFERRSCNKEEAKTEENNETST